jgi:hypothetical protein
MTIIQPRNTKGLPTPICDFSGPGHTIRAFVLREGADAMDFYRTVLVCERCGIQLREAADAADAGLLP